MPAKVQREVCQLASREQEKSKKMVSAACGEAEPKTD